MLLPCHGLIEGPPEVRPETAEAKAAIVADDVEAVEAATATTTAVVEEVRAQGASEPDAPAGESEMQPVSEPQSPKALEPVSDCSSSAVLLALAKKLDDDGGDSPPDLPFTFVFLSL